MTQDHQTGAEVGRGRSGIVYFNRDEQGRDVVAKIFGGDTASKIVLQLLTGAPNPYIWNYHAIRAAVQRRRIMTHMVQLWFGDRLTLPRTDGASWSAEHRAHVLHSEFIPGKHVPLQLASPSSVGTATGNPHTDPLADLRQNIMKPLQNRLREAGFDGLVWQAGLGNPVATNNFMLLPSAGSAVTDDDQPPFRWVWIDLESGVPALFPANPLTLFGFYLPASFRHGRPLFDDVDVPVFRDYLQELQKQSPGCLSEESLALIHEAADSLEAHQRAWKTQGRVRRSLEAARVMGKITHEQEAWYRKHPLRWMARLLGRALVGGILAMGALFKRGLRFVGKWLARIFQLGNLRFFTSQKFRTRLSRRLVARRIGIYELRRQLSRVDARYLRRELVGDESSEYITDFGVHLSVKPFIKVTQWTLVPTLVYLNLPMVAVVMVISSGATVRTLYTLGRTIQAMWRRQSLPIVALVVGVLPVVGNLAYPAQLAWAAEHRHRLARFIILDTFTTLGRRVPIWGGGDTLIEHWFNRLPLRLERWLPKRWRQSLPPTPPAQASAAAASAAEPASH